ncbi:MAG: metalloregulator ArsR/SmtB family transcription factor [Pseudomonadota bacterium]
MSSAPTIQIAGFRPDILVAALKAVAEPTRLRVLMLLRAGELNVKDLTLVLGQSQPRLSRHLKLLTEAGLVERFREGSWVYFYVSDRTEGGKLARALMTMADPTDPVLELDAERASEIKVQREASSQKYFETHAGDWDRIRSLHVSERAVERAMVSILGPGPFDTFVDLGTGTGRILQLFSQRFAYGVGFDVNQAMLTYARSKISAAGIVHAHLRHGDLYNIPMPSGEADVVVMHQVLHFLSEPQRAISEAARVLKPDGRLLVVDFLPHDFEFLRDEHAHERLGFSTAIMEGWCADAGLNLTATETLPIAIRKQTSAPGIEPAKTGRHNDDEGLTVALWCAERAHVIPEVQAPTGIDVELEEI